MVALPSPRAIRSSTSRSRGVSSPATVLGRNRVRARPSTRSATERLKHGLAGGHRADGSLDLVLLGPLQQVAARPGAQGRDRPSASSSNMVSTRTATPGRLLGICRVASTPSRSGIRRSVIDHVRSVRDGGLDRFPAGPDLTDDLQAVQGVQQGDQSTPDDRVVIGDQHPVPRSARRGASGSTRSARGRRGTWRHYRWPSSGAPGGQPPDRVGRFAGSAGWRRGSRPQAHAAGAPNTEVMTTSQFTSRAVATARRPRSPADSVC